MSLTIHPTTSIHSVGSRSSRYPENRNIDDFIDADDEALMENADIAEFLPTNDELNEQMIYSLSDDGKLIKRRYSRSQVLPGDDNNEDEIFIIPNPSNHGNDSLDKSQEEREYGNSQGSTMSRNPYQHRVNMPIQTIGTTTITLSQAKLFGLLDKEGNIVLKKSGQGENFRSSLSLDQRKKYYNSMAKPNNISEELNPDDYLDPRDIPTFKPSRSKDAERAMKDPKCGYDFMDRLDSRGDFLDRVDTRNPSGTKKLSKSQFEAMEQDYIAKHDKLQCPKCLLPQTFKEFFEKQRKCTRCNLKFDKLNVSSGLGFAKKNEMREKERLEKLRAIEVEMYGDKSMSQIKVHMKKVEKKLTVTGLKPERADDERVVRAPNLVDPAKVNTIRPKSAIVDNPSSSSTNKKPNVNDKRLNKTEPSVSGKYAVNVSEAVEKMASLNNKKAAQLHNTIEQIHSKYGGLDSFLHYDDQTTGGTVNDPKGLPPLSRRKQDTQSLNLRRDNDISSKFERLVNF